MSFRTVFAVAVTAASGLLASADDFPGSLGLKPRPDEPGAFELPALSSSPAAYLERIREAGRLLRAWREDASVVCRRDQVGEAFAKALDAFGEGEEYVWRTGPGKTVLTGTLSGPVVCAGSGRAFLLAPGGVEGRSWRGCGNIHRVHMTADTLWWSNGRLYRSPRAGGRAECVFAAASEVGGGVLGFDVRRDGSVVAAVNSMREVVELVPTGAPPPQKPFRIARRFAVDVRDAAGREPGSHGALRMIRATAQDTVVVCCAQAAKVREYAWDGRCIWKQAAPPFVFDVVRRANGNTLVSHLDGVTEFTPAHEAVWRVTCADFPELKLSCLCGLQERPDGNLVIGTWNNGSPARTNVTLFEITRDKRVVWAYRGADANLMTAERLD